jgi:4-amino-4-deoxy-L-arabinose transferase-like glycosyltransferase
MSRSEGGLPSELTTRHSGLRTTSSQATSSTLLAWWLLAWLVTAALLAALHVGSGDPDSKLYAGISARLVSLPVSQWIAPEWWGFWGLTGPYHEHPVGMFVVPAALGRLGYPAEQAAYAVNALYQVASFVLIVLIARTVLPRREADALGWLVQLLPIAFVFRIRANQEYAVLAGVLFALYACERARTRSVWVAGMLAGFVAVLLVKGVFAFMVPLTCAVWLIARGPRRPVAAWLGILLMPVAGALVTWAYESTYVHVTGRSFLEIYRARQVPEGALTTGSPVARAAYTLVWYVGRVIWFAFPWSLAAAAVTFGALRARQLWPQPPFGSRLSAAGSRTDMARSRLQAPGSVAEHDRAWQGAWFAAVATIALVVTFSLAHRKADRYIFPAYFSAAALGGVSAIRTVPWLARIAERLDRPWTAPALHVALVILRLATRGALPEFTFWRS